MDTLTAEMVHSGYRLTDDGLIYGTPRAEDDWRFDKGMVPADSFAPHGDAVWAVLDRLGWFTLEDARLLVRTYSRLRRADEAGREVQDRQRSYAAAKAACGDRLADWQSIERIVRQNGWMIRPPEAGQNNGHRRGPATNDWLSAMWTAEATAQALLVADRPELPADARERMTRAWAAAFGG